ncbi:phasin family protein [Litoribrevibacter albus]|uniref:Phasin family protein n=1 Tax=Litoribrevibacter albus TaxID=1473156 RepID=A0AA37S5Q2_9GAMM|nr:phasin family protein [Litoribrevibacter albus]GLQ29751.1 phasin family protein [Litoribrevibacter albus]
MTTDFFKDFSEKTKENFAPIMKFNELMSASIQDLFHAQMSATQRYSEMTMEQVKAASEIRDMESLQNFFQKQIGTFEALNEQVMSDLKAMADAGIKFRQDLEAIMNPAEEEQAEKKAPAKAAPKPSAKASA